MNIELKDDHDDPVFVRSFDGAGGGVEFEQFERLDPVTGALYEEQCLNIRKRDIPVLIIFLQNALKELESGNNNS